MLPQAVDYTHLNCTFTIGQPGQDGYLHANLSASWCADRSKPATVLVDVASPLNVKGAVTWTCTHGQGCRPSAGAREYLNLHGRHAMAIKEQVSRLAKQLLRLNGVVA